MTAQSVSGSVAHTDTTAIPVAGHPSAAARARGLIASPYLIVSVLTVIYAALLAYRQPWGGDFGLHTAVVDALRRDLWHPSDPMVGEAVRSPYFSPYMLLLGLVARVTGASALTVMTVAAPACIALLLYGLGRFVRIFSTNRWAPVVALALLLGLWGTAGSAWSGFFNLRGFALIGAYPSTLALGLTFLWWATLWAALERGGLLRWVGVGALFAVVVLVHQFTAVEAAVGAIALALPHLTRLRIGVAVGVVAAVVGVFVWPYFSIVDVARAAQDLDAIHQPLYADAWGAYLAVLVVCAPALVVRLRRGYLDPLVWIFILAMGVVAAGWVTDHWAFGRAWPLAMIAAQVAVAVEICTAAVYVWRARGRLSVRPLAVGAWCVAIVAALAIGVDAQMDRTRLLPTNLHQVYPARMAPLTMHIAAGEILVSNHPGTARDLLGFGVRYVTPPWPDPALPDEADRQHAVDELVAATTPAARRRALIEQYQIKWVLDVDNSWGWASGVAVAVYDVGEFGRLYQVSR